MYHCKELTSNLDSDECPFEQSKKSATISGNVNPRLGCICPGWQPKRNGLL